MKMKSSTAAGGRPMIGPRKSSAPQSAPSSPSNRPGAFMPKLSETGSVKLTLCAHVFDKVIVFCFFAVLCVLQIDVMTCNKC